MPKEIKRGTSATPFPFARQFTAPPFFVGLEDAKLKSRLLLDAVEGSRKGVAKPKPKAAKTTVKKKPSTKSRAKKK